MTRQLYLAAYDISCPNRLRRALRVARTFSSGGQKSAHECWLSPEEKDILMRNMALVIDQEEDQFALIALDPRRPVRLMGTAVKPSDPVYFYFE